MLDPATDGARCAETIHARTVDALYRSHHRPLVCYLRARLPSHEDAEELAQEAFARVLALDDMSCIENLEGYLFCVATNLVMERARRRHVRDRHEQDAYLEQVMPEPEPEHAATAQQALRILSLSIAGMPDRRRLAFERFVFADRTAGQVATEMGVSVKMIEKHVAQARAYCRQMLDAGACSLPEACSQR